MNRVIGIIDTESDEIKKRLIYSDNPRLYARECRFVSEKKIEFTNTATKTENDGKDESITAKK
jgi:hypothetical protein